MPIRRVANVELAPPAHLTAAVLRQAHILPRQFFDRDPVTVGRELLGKLLIRREGRKLLAGRIVEDEAYLGAVDPAAHAYTGRTAAQLPSSSDHRGTPMCTSSTAITTALNVSCMPEGHGGGVLLRALEPVVGLPAMAQARGLDLAADAAHLRNCG